MLDIVTVYCYNDGATQVSQQLLNLVAFAV